MPKAGLPRAVISIASWAAAGVNTTCTLNINWAKLGLSAASATITAAPISGFQDSLTVQASKPTVVVQGTKGWLLAVHG